MSFMVIWLLTGVFAQETKVLALQALVLSGESPYFIAGMAFYLMYRFRPNSMLWLVIGACWALSCYYKLRDAGGGAWPGVYQYVVPSVITAFYVVMALVATGRLRWLRWRRPTLPGAPTDPPYPFPQTVARPLLKHP